MSLRDHADHVSLTMEFRCNLKCVHCMIEGTMERLQPTPMGLFDQVLDEQRTHHRWKGLVLTGSEITLRADLPELAARARAAGFERVRIQTHGMHLSRPGYAERLLEAGVNDFFVSVAGAGAAQHDAITQVPGAWDKMLKGLEILDAHPDVRLLTNTVVTRLCYRELPQIVAELAHLKRLVQMEFWNYFPMAETDEKDLAVPLEALMPPLLQAIREARALGRFVEVKNVPECLLGDLRDALVNAQPLLMIDPAFWREFDRNGFHLCPHRTACGATECLGLTRAYVAEFGNEAALLRPYPKG
ncbi:radical SAM protein [Pseudooceanicola sp. GBMRC 2024]|uniref:Radical SAM protein n=1 Tax=Pseudooceanicola albus TaxID=2692189 RepID=A0A6L7G6J1_9RHOB|nr:radical SAM protein [Pseudooceanicola albus]